LTNNTDKNYDYSAVPREYAASFVIGQRAFIGLGNKSGLRSDFWQYDPTTDAWTQKTAFAGAARSQAVGFVLGNYGYVGTGVTGSLRLDDLWQLDPDATDE